MQLQRLRTSDQFFSFERPTSVYKEMYTMDVERAKRATKRLGVLPSLLLSLIVVAAIAFALSFAEEALAADPGLTIRDDGYAAKYVSQSELDPITIEAGATKTILVNFQNVGTESWVNEGAHYISAYTMEPRDRDSIFYTPYGWNSPQQIGRMVGTVKPGEIGEFGIPLQAPDEPGEYTEEFHLAAENWTWVDGGYFFLKINVVEASETVNADPIVSVDEGAVEDPVAEDVVVEDAEDEVVGTYQAKQIMLNKKSVEAEGGEQIKLVLGYQNLGTAFWDDFQVTASAVSLAGSTAPTFADESWESASIISSGATETDQFGTVKQKVFFRTPATIGDYTMEVTFWADGKPLHVTSIPVTVTSDAPDHYVAPEFDDDTPVFIPRIEEEPRIRIGLWNDPVGNDVQFVSYETAYNVFQGTELVGVLDRANIAHLDYGNGEYSFDGGDLDFTSDTYIRLSPISSPSAIFELYNWERRVSWKGDRNFNQYRGAMEYRLGEINPIISVVNDTLMEDYMKGIGENADSSNFEYLKSQTVAQRSYAYATIQSDKYGIFDVVATTGDQLFLGVQSEEMMPNFVRAVGETRGYMATYDVDADVSTPNTVVITPYYGNSDGYTRGWHEVWGGPVKPWLVAVEAEYDAGRRMLGHGVGMAQRDAVIRADEEGLGWEELVQYYYTGVAVERMYE